MMSQPEKTVSSRPWHALGLAAGLISALMLSIAEWVRLLGLDPAPLQGSRDHLIFVATAACLFGLVTVPIGFGLGLGLSGFRRWLGLPDSWRRLRDDPDFRNRHETNFSALLLLIPIMAITVAGSAFVVERAFVRQMNNPTLAAAFIALTTAIAVLSCVAFSGVGVVAVGWVLDHSGARRLAKREPRLLRAVILVTLVGFVFFTTAAFALLYNPVVWPLLWVIFLLGTVLMPVVLTLSGPLIAWARVARAPIVMVIVAIAIFGGTALTFATVGGSDGPRVALLNDAVFTPTLAGAVHKLSDSDGDGQASWLGGSDCDDSNPAVYAGAAEIPGNGIDDNCLGGDSQLTEQTPEEPVEADVQGEPAEPPAEDTPIVEAPIRRNIVFILVDTLRPDHMGFYGYERDLSPRMDDFASHSVAFARTYAQAPHTPRSIPSIFTSRYSSHIAFDRPRTNYPELRDENLTFFEVLDEAGYFNLAVTSHYYFEPVRGMGQGFDEWDNRGAMSISDTNTAIAAPDIFAHLSEHIPDLVENFLGLGAVFISIYEK